MSAVGDSIGRMSQREKVLVGSLIAIVVASAFGLFNLFVGSQVSELEERIEEDRKALKSIYAKADAFIAKKSATESLQRMAADSEELNLKLAVNKIARKISYQARNRSGEPAGSKRLADVMQFDQTQETFLSKKKKRKAKGKKNKKEAAVGYYRRDQPVTMSDGVPFRSIYDLMDQIESSNDLLYVTEIEVNRDFKDGRNARKNAKLVVSTYYYKGLERDKDPDPSDGKDSDADGRRGAGSKP